MKLFNQLSFDAYKWRFGNVGGSPRVLIENGQDIAHLPELDRKLWTVLSCPVQGLEFDEDTLRMMDNDKDGKIRVDEIIEAVQWITAVLKDPQVLIAPDSEMPLSVLNVDVAEGRQLYDSAKQILSNLGLDKETISVADTSNETAIFAKTGFNGDGIITELSTDDETLKKTIAACIATVGSLQDRCGLAGVDEAKINAFYDACAAYVAWKEAYTKDIQPYGENTEAAYAAWKTIKEKIDDYFMRCRLVAFDNDSTKVLDVQVARIEAISANSLTSCKDEIASYPLARICGSQVLSLKDSVNPAWQAAFDSLKKLVLEVELAGKDAMTESEWNSIEGKFAAYEAWKGAKKGVEVESLGLDAVKAFLAENRKEDLLKLIANDKALEAEANGIEAVNKLTHYYRDLYHLIRNYVTMSDFYAPDTKAIFQAGTLFIDQRSCDLCIKVSDMGAQNASASLSGMYLIYCNCTSKVKAAPMTIVAVLTNGEVRNLRVGMNAIFYDRDGQDWDAVVTKIVENPISVKEAFLSPYRKLGKFCSDLVGKLASDKESKVTAELQNSVSKAANEAASATPESVAAAKAAKAGGSKQAFDITKFLGLFAVLSMALAEVGDFLMKLFSGFTVLVLSHWWSLPVMIIAIVLIISGPSMLIAWTKLRKRNLAPILNANGWAINAAALVNVTFGVRLTAMAGFPLLKIIDPSVAESSARLRKILHRIFIVLAIVIAVLAIVFAVLYFTNSLARFNLPFNK